MTLSARHRVPVSVLALALTAWFVVSGLGMRTPVAAATLVGVARGQHVIHTLRAVSCASPSNCFAVGDGSVTDSWDGHKWSAIPAAAPSGSSAVLMGVSCATRSRCFAVGWTGSQPYAEALVERWDGRRWTITPGPPAPGGAASTVLNSIWCRGTSLCFAAGTSVQPGGSYPFIGRWNGKHWMREAAPADDAGSGYPEDDSLFGVTCASARSCFAVGGSIKGEPQYGGCICDLIEHWNGSRWSLQAGAGQGEGSVACPGPRLCFAAGGYGLEEWNGARWSGVSLPGLEPLLDLSGVSCVGPTACFAVGWGAQGTGVDRWDGKHWSAASRIYIPGTAGGYFGGVSCPTTSTCFAVGSYQNAYSGAWVALIERWDGSHWSIVVGKSIVRNIDALASVLCSSPSTCVAAGIFHGHASGVTRPLFEQTTARHAWFVAPAGPPVARGELQLTGVACALSSRCFAVGFEATSSANGEQVIYARDGARWSEVPSLTVPGAILSKLQAVTCAGPATCFAVGSYSPRPLFTDLPLVERWDGTHWSSIAAAIPEGSEGAKVTLDGLTSVACSLPTSCFAVGYQSRNGQLGPLIEHWNGSSWSISAVAPYVGGVLVGVACPGTSTCLAVGIEPSNGNVVLERWNGSGWSLESNAWPGQDKYLLMGFACTGASSCLAVGLQTGGNGAAFVLRWNGAAWKALSLPSPSGAISSQLSGVSCAGETCIAVGSFADDAGQFTLVEKWDGGPWTILASRNE